MIEGEDTGIMTGSPEVRLVPHTHWDREWYEPFQRFRLRLVDLLDEVLDRAEADPRFRFTLDGQMAAADDYLEVRGEHRDRVAALVAEGRLAVGPWQILLDEFLVSGENIIRNLELGWARANDLGGAMRVGYLPDEFGHCAQMPQILAGAGFEHACLWRGVPSTVEGHAFRWQAPDGSSVRVEYLFGGYGNAAYVLSDPDFFAERMAALGKRLAPVFGDDPVLAMYGTDHSAPVGSLVKLVAGLDENVVDVRISTLADYIGERDAAEPGLPVVSGELRSHAAANILPGVLSVRPQLKQAMAKSERLVERYAEPFAALWSAEWPQRFLDMAWWRLVDASGHDSVTGCGVDETAVQVYSRITEAGHLGEAVRDRVVGGLARSVSRDSVLVVNPSAHARRDLIAMDLEIREDWESVAFELPDGTHLQAQASTPTSASLHEESLSGVELPSFFTRIHGRELFGLEVAGWAVDHEEHVLTFDLAGHGGEEPFDIEAVRAAVHGVTGEWTVRLRAAQRRVVTGLVDVPALGWATVRPVRGTDVEHAVSVDGRSLTNGLIEVIIADDGTMRITSADGTVLDGVGRIVDGGDRGDTYNYAPPGTDTLIDTARTVEISAGESGPLRASVTITRKYDWPAAMDWTGDRRTPETRPGTVHMRLELRAGEPFARLGFTIDNAGHDHRVRLHVPLGRPAVTSHAEGQFAVVERGLAAGGGCGEYPVPTFPAHGFADAGGAGILLTQAGEYELLDGELAVTLLRCTGQISRNVHPYREEPAGPQIPTPLAQMVGTTTVGLAVRPHSGDWLDADLLTASEHFRHPLHAVTGQGPLGSALASQEGLMVTGAVMTSLRRRDGALEVRIVAQAPDSGRAVVRGRFTRASRVDLLGRPVAEVPVADGVVEVELRGWEIATLRLE